MTQGDAPKRFEGALPIRLFRDGRWRSVSLADLTEISDQELADLPASVGAALLADMREDGWLRDPEGARWLCPAGWPAARPL